MEVSASLMRRWQKRRWNETKMLGRKDGVVGGPAALRTQDVTRPNAAVHYLHVTDNKRVNMLRQMRSENGAGVVTLA